METHIGWFSNPAIGCKVCTTCVYFLSGEGKVTSFLLFLFFLWLKAAVHTGDKGCTCSKDHVGVLTFDRRGWRQVNCQYQAVNCAAVLANLENSSGNLQKTLQCFKSKCGCHTWCFENIHPSIIVQYPFYFLCSRSQWSAGVCASCLRVKAGGSPDQWPVYYRVS